MAGVKQRFQFSLQGLMIAVAIAAVIAWNAMLIGIGAAIALLLVVLGLWVIRQRPLEGGLALLGIAMAMTALCSGLFYYGYYVQLRTVNSVLAEFPEIDKVWLCTNDDVTLEVEGLWFSTLDQPEAVFEIGYGIDGASKSTIRTRLRKALRERRPVTLPAHARYRLR